MSLPLQTPRHVDTSRPTASDIIRTLKSDIAIIAPSLTIDELILREVVEVCSDGVECGDRRDEHHEAAGRGGPPSGSAAHRDERTTTTSDARRERWGMVRGYGGGEWFVRPCPCPVLSPCGCACACSLRWRWWSGRTCQGQRSRCSQPLTIWPTASGAPTRLERRLRHRLEDERREDKDKR